VPRTVNGTGQPLNNWNVGEVTTMEWMFDRTSAFDQDLSDWNVVKVRDMRKMFWGAGNSTRTSVGAWKASTLKTRSQ